MVSIWFLYLVRFFIPWSRIRKSNMSCIVAMAFDEECNRIGHGKGYYDRYIRRCHEWAIKNNRNPPKTGNFPMRTLCIIARGSSLHMVRSRARPSETDTASWKDPCWANRSENRSYHNIIENNPFTLIDSNAVTKPKHASFPRSPITVNTVFCCFILLSFVRWMPYES